jgi:hypothetical protein
VSLPNTRFERTDVQLSRSDALCSLVRPNFSTIEDLL